MDINWEQAYAVAVTVIAVGWEAWRRVPRKANCQAEAATSLNGSPPSSNGNGNGKPATQSYVDLRLLQHERDCPNAVEVKAELGKLRSELSTGLRGVHERLDRVIERRAP